MHQMRLNMNQKGVIKTRFKKCSLKSLRLNWHKLDIIHINIELFRNILLQATHWIYKMIRLGPKSIDSINISFIIVSMRRISENRSINMQTNGIRFARSLSLLSTNWIEIEHRSNCSESRWRWIA